MGKTDCMCPLLGICRWESNYQLIGIPIFWRIYFIYCLVFLDLIEPSLAIGRSDECDIVIHKSKFPANQIFFISKKHFVIRKDSEDKHITYITDLSKNGTYVNNCLIGRNKTIILQNNDLLAIGEKLVGKFAINSWNITPHYDSPKENILTCLNIGY